jgi:hypothetical protein
MANSIIVKILFESPHIDTNRASGVFCAPRQMIRDKGRNGSLADNPAPPADVRFAANSVRLLRRREVTLCAKRGHRPRNAANASTADCS